MVNRMIDWGFIGTLEGNRLTGYVPDAANSKSGVTVASGVDLGNMTAQEFGKLSSPLQLKVRPYFGLKGAAASARLSQFPLSLSAQDAAELDSIAQTADLDNIIFHYATLSGKQFNDLTNAAQTVLASVGFQYGNVWDDCPKFWQAACDQNYVGMIAELNHFDDNYPTRRKKEADYLLRSLPSAMTVKLGKGAVKHDPRNFKMARYVKTPLPAKPDMCTWNTAISDWKMMLNDTLGCCTASSVGHIIMSDTANNGHLVIPTDSDVEAFYSGSCGYIPGKPETDQGGVEIDVLNYWRKTGMAGHKILAYVQIDATDFEMVKEAIFLFGSVYAGVQLPLNAQQQNPWHFTTNKGQGVPGSWGGHAVPLLGYDTDALFCPTWGENQWLTKDWWLEYGDEAYAIITEDWVPPSGVSPSHFNLAQLNTDLSAL